MHKFLVSLSLATMLSTVSGAALAAGEKVSVITPYLSATATAEMVEAFKAQAAEKGWTVDVVDTAGDMGAFASRVEDATTSGANAIVLVSVDPAQIQDQVDKAKAAGIPVVTIDGAKNASTVLNVTSDNYVLGETMTQVPLGQIGGKGKIVRFFHSAHPGVRQREIALDDALKANPGRQGSRQPLRAGSRPDRRQPRRHGRDPARQSRRRGDQRRLGGLGRAGDRRQASPSRRPAARASSSPASTATREAVELIKACGNYIGTVRQGFGEMANIAAGELNKLFAGAAITSAWEVAVGGGDDAHVDAAHPVLAHPLQLALLQRAQQARLQVRAAARPSRRGRGCRRRPPRACRGGRAPRR